MAASPTKEYRHRRLQWAMHRLKRLAPDYRFRWEIYFERLNELAQDARMVLDAGCGDNSTLAELPDTALGVGVDIVAPPAGTRGVCARLDHLPFPSESFDLIGCRYVTEHLEDPAAVFAELARVARPGATLLLQTVNRRSPLIRFSRLLGLSLRRRIVRQRYGSTHAPSDPSRDRYNTPELLENPPPGWSLRSVTYTQDIDTESRVGFWLTYRLYRWTRSRPHRRSTVTVEWQRV